MHIVYDREIIYEPERLESRDHQKLVANVAILLLSKEGQIYLIEPNNVKIVYDVNSGEVTLESQIGSVNNTLSDLEKSITQPVKQAISRIATFELLKRVATSGKGEIASLINKNHPNLDNPQENMHKLGSTLIAINQLIDLYEKRSLLNNIKWFKQENNKSVYAIEALVRGNVHSLKDVEEILPVQRLKVSR
jgi:hypothetical protein